jgi:peptidoglycan/LPS O-acetylase OafA/YrhL
MLRIIPKARVDGCPQTSDCREPKVRMTVFRQFAARASCVRLLHVMVWVCGGPMAMAERTGLSPKYVVGLDLVRFAAASSVMFYHLALASWAGTDQTIGRFANYKELLPFSWIGWAGVEVFFVISGFVIAFSSVGRTAADFLQHRINRLYPGAWVCATVTFVVAQLLHTDYRHTLVFKWLASLTLWPFAAPIDGQYWTLSVELAFYGLITLCLAFRLLKRPELIFLPLAIVSAAYNVFAVLFARQFALHIMWHIWAELSLIEYGCLFALGGLIWLAFDRGWSRLRVVAIAIAITGCCAETLLKSDYNRHLFARNANVFLPVGVLLLSIAAICAAVRFNAQLQPFTGRWGREIGLATYPLYLLHNLIGLQFLRFAVPLIGKWWALGLAFALCIALAFAAVRLERIVQALIRPWLFGRRPRLAAAVG